MIPYSKQTISFLDVYRVAFQLKFKSLTQGSKTLEFENAISKYTGSKYVVAVSSATAGLHLGVKALKLPENSIIATSPTSFVASANSIIYNNCIPKFIDINSNTINLCIETLEEELRSGMRISAIIIVHFAGHACDMQKLHNLSKEYDFKIIEDAAHALGGKYSDGSQIGNSKYSDLTVFSLHPVKSITSGEGGVITTNSYEIYKELLRLRSHGINKLNDEYRNVISSKTLGENNPWYYEMIELGYNYRLTDFQSALALSQLKKLDKFIAKRQKLAQKYLKDLRYSNKVSAVIQEDDVKNSALHLFLVKIDFASIKVSKRSLIERLKEKKIGSQVHYMPIPLQPFYIERGYKIEDYPNSMMHYMQTLSIPLHPTLKKKRTVKIIRSIETIIDGE